MYGEVDKSIDRGVCLPRHRSPLAVRCDRFCTLASLYFRKRHLNMLGPLLPSVVRPLLNLAAFDVPDLPSSLGPE